MRNTQFTVDHGSKQPIFSTVANVAGSGAGQSLHPCIQPQSPSTAQSPPPRWETKWKLTTDIFQVDYNCWKTEFTLISIPYGYGFPFLLSSPGTKHLISNPSINPVYLVFACLHGTLTDIDLSVVLSLDWPKDCGLAHFRPNTVERIVSGNEARPHSWPWQVSLQVISTWYDTERLKVQQKRKSLKLVSIFIGSSKRQ